MVDIPKRKFIAKLAATGLAIPTALAAAREFAFAQSGKPAPVILPQQGPPPGSSPDTAPTTPTELDPKMMLKEHQKQIRMDVEKLYDLAGELKDQVEKTETEHVLSLPMIQKAEQIEKLAKQVKTLARGD